MGSNASSSGSQAGAHLAAFGKHPGWNDHIDDIGVDTARLVAVKRSLYFDGVGGNVDAGAWQSLGEHQRLPGFNHTWVWRHPDSLVMGRMWASRDGKGRAHYPMIVCAQNSDGLLPDLLAGALPLLRRLEAQCKEASTAAEVIAAMDRMRGEFLASASWHDTGGTADGSLTTRVLADLAECVGLHDESPPFHRILYRIEREMAAYLRSARRGEAANRGPVHIRVPSVTDDERQSLARWCLLMLTLLDPSTPLLLVRPDQAAWVDILVGEPKTQQFYCMLATPEAVPLASDIPYTIDAPFLERADTLVNGWRADGEGVEDLLRIGAYGGDDEASGFGRLLRPVKGLFGRHTHQRPR